MDRNKAKDIGTALVAALTVVAKAHDLDLVFGGGTFDGGTYKPKVEFKERDSDEKRFRTFAMVYGLVPSDFGRAFMNAGRKHTIVALKLTRTTKPVVTMSSEGKRYVWSVAIVKALLDASGV